MAQSTECFYSKCNECAVMSINGCSCSCHTTRVSSPYYKPITSYSMLKKVASKGQLISGLDEPEAVSKQETGILNRTRGRPPKAKKNGRPRNDE